MPLIEPLAREFAAGSVVLIGPLLCRLPEGLTASRHLLGPRSYAEMPAYVQHFDVGVIPYVRSPSTDAVDPLKLLECCAAGIALVTTGIPEARKYGTTVCVADTEDAFVDGVRAALAEDRATSRARGQALARQHTWRRRADDLLAILHGLAEEWLGAPAVASAGAAS
jgi:hypothetical protein